MVNIDKIKQLTKENGLKIQAVCEKIGASRYRFYDWERGKSSPSESDLERLACVLNTTVDYLTDKTDIKEQKNKPTEQVSEPRPELDELKRITSDFSPEEFRTLLEDAKLLALRRNKSTHE